MGCGICFGSSQLADLALIRSAVEALSIHVSSWQSSRAAKNMESQAGFTHYCEMPPSARSRKRQTYAKRRSFSHLALNRHRPVQEF
jgi:hypothetical protein